MQSGPNRLLHISGGAYLMKGTLPSNWTVHSIWPTQKRTVATDAKTLFCRSTVTSFYAFSPRTWASTLIRCSMQSYGRFITAPIDAS